MASVVSCLAAKRSAPPAWQKPNRYSLACSRNSDCPVASAPTTGCRLPPTPWLASHSFRRGGYASASYPSSSNPVNRNRTDATNACIARSKPKRPPANTSRAQQRKFDRFRHEFNFERPHEALDQQTPASLYATSPRAMPTKIPPLEYPYRLEARCVSATRGIRWNKQCVNVSTVCAGEHV